MVRVVPQRRSSHSYLLADLLAELPKLSPRRAQPLYADLAARLPLTAEQWQQVPAPCAGLIQALPAVLARSEAEAATLVAHLSEHSRECLVLVATALACAVSTRGLSLPADVQRCVLAAWLAAECGSW